MQTSESLNELAAALAKAQASYKAIGKDKKVKTNQYSYTYADLATVMEAIRPALNANGLAVVQSVATNGNTAAVTTRLIHASGQWVESVMNVVAEGAGVQKLGSAVTYARRYSFLALTGSAPTDEDDDGIAAMTAGPPGDSRTSAEVLAQVRQKQAKAVEEFKKEEPLPEVKPETGQQAGDAMRTVMAKLRAQTKKGTATQRKSEAFAYLIRRHGGENLLSKLEEILGRAVPRDEPDILINMTELERIEGFIVAQESTDHEHQETRN